MLRTPAPHTILQVRSHESRAEGQEHLPRPAGHAPFDAAQDTVGFLGCKRTLQPAHVHFFINPHPQVLLCRAALNLFSAQPGAVPGLMSLFISSCLSTRNCLRKMSQLPPESLLASPVSEGTNPRVESLDNLSMDSFWLEVENIKQSAEVEQEECSLADVKAQEEGEAEAEWLQDTGLSNLLGDCASEHDNILLLSTLTKTQAAAVQRRLDTYSRSRRRNKHPVRDVRDIFGVVTETQDYSCTVRNPGKEEMFNMDVAYSEQAAVLLKGSFLSESRKLKDGNALTKFKIPKGRLGVTRIGDLSAQDMKKIPTLALIELTALCDILGLELKRNKAAKLKTTEKRLFGVPLNTLLENDQKLLPSTKVPLLLQALLSCLEKRGLETEGILRVSGSQTRIKSLEQKLERDFYTGLFRWDEVHQNDVSGLLKRFIRELPAPLLTAEYLPAFAAVQNIPDLKQRLQALNLLILILPEPNRNTLKALLEFLSKVVARENNNKMNLWNVSTVMAPNLFMHKGLPNKIPEGKEKQLAEGAADVVRMMIHYQDLLWTVSSFLVAQVRKLNESNSKRYQFCDKRIKHLLRKIHADKDKAEKKQAEVKMLFVWFFIGEHCLDPDTYLLDLYHINPHAEWIIKQNPSYPRLF
uniref:Rho GTPase activating protein 40 n=1 Tax=Amazona collaria TaxID=241587 RepID=A0A8B9FZS6_9PSIT